LIVVQFNQREILERFTAQILLRLSNSLVGYKSLSLKGTLIGAKVGALFGLTGVAVGAFVGGTVGYMAGSKVGEVVTKGFHKVRDYAREVVKDFSDKVYSGAKTAVNNVKNFMSGLVSW
jgi:phage tail tape-measure protein